MALHTAPVEIRNPGRGRVISKSQNLFEVCRQRRQRLPRTGYGVARGGARKARYGCMSNRAPHTPDGKRSKNSNRFSARRRRCSFLPACVLPFWPYLRQRIRCQPALTRTSMETPRSFGAGRQSNRTDRPCCDKAGCARALHRPRLLIGASQATPHRNVPQTTAFARNGDTSDEQDL